MNKTYDDNSIKVLEDLEHIRLRPTMFIGYVGWVGTMKLFREAFDNVIDEMTADRCNQITIIFEQYNNSFVLTDDGNGIPVRSLVDACTKKACGAKFNTDVYRKTVGLNGIGLKAIAALSKEEVVTSVSYNADIDSNEIMTVKFKDGKFSSKSKIKTTDKSTGLTISFTPDVTIMGEIDLPSEEIVKYVKNISYLLPGRKFNLLVKDNGCEIYKEYKFMSSTGISDAMNDFVTDKNLYVPVEANGVHDDKEFEVIFTHDPKIGDEQILSFANNAITFSHGKHVDGFKKALADFARKYIKSNLTKDKNSSVRIQQEDACFGLKAVISMSYTGDKETPLFQGQAKEELTNDSALLYMNKVITKVLTKWALDNPIDCKNLCTTILKVAINREKSKKSTIKSIGKINSGFSSNMPDKYDKPIVSDNMELYIVEGDSAKGGLMNRRFDNQGLLPLRGVTANAFALSDEDVMKSAVYRDLMTIIGTGVGKKFSIKQCKFERIIIATDADIDGHNIRRLILGFFIKHMPELIYQGRIFVLATPLFVTTNKRGNAKYLYDKTEYNAFRVSNMLSDLSVSDLDGNILSKRNITNMIDDLDLYYKTLYAIGKRFKAPIYILEMLSYYEFNDVLLNDLHKDEDFECKITLGSTHVQHNGILVDLPNLPRLNKELSFLSNLLKNSKHDFEYIVNGQRMTVGVFLDKVDKYSPKVQRFKGLGEMEPDNIELTCMDPKTRKLIQIVPHTSNLDDIYKDLDIIYGDNSPERVEMIKNYQLSESDYDN